MALSKGVYSKDDCGKLKIKDSNHTRCSKQNTYHVVNKNIAPSKVTDGSRRKRGCLPGHPQALAFWSPQIILGCHEHPQAQDLATPCSIIHQIFYPKLENFTTQNLTENLVSSVSERKKTPLQGTVMYSFFIYIGVKPTVFQVLYGSYHLILAIDASK